VLFRRAIQLSVSGKHWAEIIYGWPIEMLSGMNKSRIAIKTRRIILLLSPEGSLCSGEPCPTQSRPANWISLVFSEWPLGPPVPWPVRGLVSATRAITSGSGTASWLKA